MLCDSVAPSAVLVSGAVMLCTADARGSALGGRAACRVRPIPGSWFEFPARSVKLFMAPGSVNSNQTLLRRIKHWLVHRLATATHCVGQIRVQAAIEHATEVLVRCIHMKWSIFTENFDRW